MKTLSHSMHCVHCALSLYMYLHRQLSVASVTLSYQQECLNISETRESKYIAIIIPSMCIRGSNTVVIVFVCVSVFEHLIASHSFTPRCLPFPQLDGFFESRSSCSRLGRWVTHILSCLSVLRILQSPCFPHL